MNEASRATAGGASGATRGASRAVGVGLAVAVVGVLPSFMLGALAVQMGRDLGFGPAGLGGATAAFFVVSAIGSLPLGLLADRLGGPRSLRFSALGSAACSAAVALLARSYPSLIAVLLAGGAANGMTQPAVNAFLAGRVPADRQGVVFGIKQSAIPGAVLLSGLSVPLVALTVGWRWAYVGAAVLSLAVAAAVRSEPATPGSAPAPVDAARSSRAPVRTPSARVLGPLAFAACLGAFSGTALGAFVVTSAVAAGIEEGRAGILLAAGSAVCILVRVAAGWLADRRASEGLMPAAGLLAGGTFGFVLLALGSPAAVVVGSLLGFGLTWASPGLLNFAVVARTPGAAARATGVTQSGVYVGAGLGPLVFGQIVVSVSLGAAWIAAAVSAALAGAIVAWWRRAEMRSHPVASGSRPFHVPSAP